MKPTMIYYDKKTSEMLVELGGYVGKGVSVLPWKWKKTDDGWFLSLKITSSTTQKTLDDALAFLQNNLEVFHGIVYQHDYKNISLQISNDNPSSDFSESYDAVRCAFNLGTYSFLKEKER